MKLNELIRDRKGDRSYETLERDCGGTPKAARLQQIATKPLKAFPDPENIRGLARGLGVPERVVLTAAAESLGFTLTQAPTKLEQWIPSEKVADLSPRQIDLVLGIIDALAPADSETRFADGGVLLFVPRVESTGSRGEAVLKTALDDAFPAATSAEVAAHAWLSKWVGPYLWAIAEERLHSTEWHEYRAHPLPSAARPGVVAATNSVGMTLREWTDGGGPESGWHAFGESLVSVPVNEEGGEEHDERSAPTKPAGRAPAKDDVDLAARRGVSDLPDTSQVGEHSQDPGGFEPA